MLLQVALAAALALGAAPCVLQRACPPRAPRPPSSVCMHRLQPGAGDNGDDSNSSPASKDARTLKAGGAPLHARVLLQALLGLPLVLVLRVVSLFLLQGGIMIVIFIFAMFSGIHQITANCKNSMMLGKDERAMFRAHSDACRTQSQVEQQLIDDLLCGKLLNDPRLKKHIYCVLLKCKIISKDGKLQKAAVLGKMGTRLDGKNVTKVLENCANPPGESPEDLAWNLFRCGYDRKAVLFDFMPAGSNGTDENDAL